MKKISYIILSFLIYVTAPFSMDELDSILSAPEEHARFIRSSLGSAQSRVVIVSPFITSWRLTDNDFNSNDGLGKHIHAAIQRGVEVSVFTDAKFDENNRNAIQGRAILANLVLRFGAFEGDRPDLI